MNKDVRVSELGFLGKEGKSRFKKLQRSVVAPLEIIYGHHLSDATSCRHLRSSSFFIVV